MASVKAVKGVGSPEFRDGEEVSVVPFLQVAEGPPPVRLMPAPTPGPQPFHSAEDPGRQPVAKGGTTVSRLVGVRAQSRPIPLTVKRMGTGKVGQLPIITPW